MSRARKLSLLAAAGWLLSFFLLARLFAVSDQGGEFRLALAAACIVLLVASGWLTGRVVVARRRGE